MKYINIKRYKFSTVLKNFNTLIIKNFSTLIVKNLKTLGNNVVKLFKFINLKKYDLKISVPSLLSRGQSLSRQCVFLFTFFLVGVIV